MCSEGYFGLKYLKQILRRFLTVPWPESLIDCWLYCVPVVLRRPQWRRHQLSMIISLLSKTLSALRSSCFIHPHLWSNPTPSRFLEPSLVTCQQYHNAACVSIRICVRGECKLVYKAICVRAWRKEIIVDRERERESGMRRWSRMVSICFYTAWAH